MTCQAASTGHPEGKREGRGMGQIGESTDQSEGEGEYRNDY